MSEQPVTSAVPEWDLADRLRKALRHGDVGVAEMGEWLEVSRHTIGNWINGHTRPRPAELKQWALRCGVDYRWLTTGIPSNGSRGEHVDSHHEHRPDDRDTPVIGKREITDWSKKINPDWNTQLHRAIPTDPRPRSLEAA